jgi:hypothetical protein
MLSSLSSEHIYKHIRYVNNSAFKLYSISRAVDTYSCMTIINTLTCITIFVLFFKHFFQVLFSPGNMNLQKRFVRDELYLLQNCDYLVEDFCPEEQLCE